MANYTPTFTKPYPSGWVDKPSKTTPATAAIMNSYDTAIAALESYLRDNTIDTVTVSVEQFPSDGREWLGTITVGSNQYRIYMPSLKYENSVSGGIKIGTITLGEQSFDVYAPAYSAGGSTVSVVPKTLTGTNIAEITVDGTTYQLYAPTSGGGSGSTVTAEATLTEGTQIGKITIDGTETILYAPTASLITVDAELSATSENPVQNKVVTAELDKKLEVLGDESQAPDAVNFDLDSELSLTSVKGVQNKVIAEEFQKYANGTKVVAKATEAETAKTAASATTAQSATTAESATKATQDAQGNVIDTTYAKKTEIPQGAVVDDALSSTSTNPVQNKVVKAEFNRVDSNLTDLKYGEVAGGKNLFTLKGKEIHTDNVKYEVINENSVSITGNDNCPSNQWVQIVVKNIKVKKNTDYVLSIGNVSNALSDTMCAVVRTDTSVTIGSMYNVQSNALIKFHVRDYDNVFIILRHSQNDSSGASNHTIIWSDLQIEEGTQATDYEPYIPSVKMLAEEDAQQSTDLSNLKDGTTPVAKAVADEDGNNIKSTYATKAEIPSAPSSLYETVKVGITTDLFAKSATQHYVNCERVGNICTLSFWLQATASVDYKNRHELFYIDKIPKNNLTIGFCVVNFNQAVSNTANSAYNYINSISVQEDYNAILKRNASKVYLLPYRTGSDILSSGYEIIGQISWAVEV